ncbi:MAG TPA: histidinol-phosphate transaminase [Acidimicrobiales bacterium]|nr:histidinol-phosphate transaminase [Acidimicrobiales bacterium]
MPPVPVRADLDLFEGYHSPQLDVAVRLNTNESPIAPPRAWVDALCAELARIEFHRYPDRRAWALRSALAKVHGVRPEEVFCANGSNEVLQCLLLAFGGPGRSVAVFEPTYALHSHIARLTGTRVATGERLADFRIDLDEVRRVNDEAAPVVTFLCSPNNPSGRADSEQVVDQVLNMAPGLVVVDEAYGQFCSWSALSMLGDHDRLVVVRTFSKTWSMAAARLGYLVAPASVVAALEQVVLPYHLDAIKQVAGRLALDYRADMDNRVAVLVEERGRLVAALGALPVESWPSDANFILFRPLTRPGDEVWQGLVDRSVLVRNCSGWPRLDGCLRVTVGTPEENTAFLDALTACLK